MTLDEMIEEFRYLMPGAKSTVMNDTRVTTLLNRGVRKCNEIAQIYGDDDTIDLAEGIYKYSISEELPTMLDIDKSGCWFLDGTKWRKVYPKTEKWMDENIQNWRDVVADSNAYGNTRYVWTKGDDIYIYPAPDEAITGGLKVYFLVDPTDMSNGSNYPWHNTTTEIKRLRPMDDAIIAYARWKSSATLGKDSKGALTQQEFRKEVIRAKRQVNKRLDIEFDRDYGMKFSI